MDDGPIHKKLTKKPTKSFRNWTTDFKIKRLIFAYPSRLAKTQAATVPERPRPAWQKITVSSPFVSPSITQSNTSYNLWNDGIAWSFNGENRNLNPKEIQIRFFGL